jgi:putative transcription antitermination factor YqgF
LNREVFSPLIGVDLGRRSAGLAFSPDGQLIFKLGQLSFFSENELIKKLQEKVGQKERVAKVIFGLPLNRKGRLTNQARWVKKLAQRFSKESGFKVDFVDEYLTTWQARQNLVVGERSEKRRGSGPGPNNYGDEKKRLDQEAAKIILEEYIKERERTREENPGREPKA